MTTLVTSANVQVNSFLTQGTQLPIVIVDEATQCTESQCIVPLCVQPALLILVGAALWLRPVMYVAFDREFARSRGIHTRVISYLMAALVAVTIVLSIRIMGIVLLISLLTMPVVIVNTFTRSYRRIAAAAPVVAVAGNVAGLAASYHFEVPPGAAIIFTLTLTLIGVKLLTLHSKNRRVSA